MTALSVRWLKILGLCLPLCGLTTIVVGKTTGDQKAFGKPLHAETKKIPLPELLKNPAALADQTVRTTGQVEKVCQKKGCWLTLKTQGGADQGELRVTFKDYGFFVPTEIIGRAVEIEGKVVEKTRSEAEVRHFAEDAGRPLPKEEKIVEKKVYEMIATGVVPAA